MTKKKEERYSDIIHEFYNSNFEEDAAIKVRGKFVRWFFNDTDRQKKDAAIEDLGVPAKGANMLTSEEVQKLEEAIIAKRQHEMTSKKVVKMTFARTMTRVAAVLIPLIVVTGIWLFNKDSQSFTASYEVPYGKVEEQTLGDSTKVSLNAGSKLVIAQNKTERIAELVGEAYFRVTKDAERPFMVKTQDLAVTVLGTEFNVEAYPDSDETIVTLNSGKVAINTKENKQYELLPDQQFIYTRSTGEGMINCLEQVKTEEVSEWTQGQLVFNNITLNEALRTIERRYGVNAEIAENYAMLNDIIIIKLDSSLSLEEAMKRINIIVPSLNYKIENNRLIISEN